MIRMVNKEKVFGWAKSRKGLERDKVTQRRQRGPPGCSHAVCEQKVYPTRSQAGFQGTPKCYRYGRFLSHSAKK